MTRIVYSMMNQVIQGSVPTARFNVVAEFASRMVPPAFLLYSLNANEPICGPV